LVYLPGINQKRVMALIRSLPGKTPKFGKDCFLAENATIIGEVDMGDYCSVWYGAVIRGDVHYIKIGNNTNIQDNAVIHATYLKSPANIGNNVTIAHGAIVHGCTVRDNVMIGMNAVVLDDAVIESNTIIAAGSVVTKGTHVESGSIYAGIPARKIREISPELLEGEVKRIASSYKTYADWYQDEMG
jgi:carbonic anhydrase/acetyltransferase-like protein (isoleucine patch superfamily)